MHIFMKIGAEEKLRGEERLNYLNTVIFALFSSYFLKIFLARSARSITLYFHPPIRGRGTYGRNGKVRLAFKSGTKKRRFSVQLLMT